MTEGSSRHPKEEIIALRMKEYESLRAEVTQRVNARQQIAGFAGVISALLSTGSGFALGSWKLYLAVMIMGLAVLWLRDSNQAIQRIGVHLQHIEDDVNQLSQEIYGRSALSWETRRQRQRDREKTVWKLGGSAGGWHLKDPARHLPPPP
ncbi:hypothetical protein WEB32_02280 [Streptomyces netropsis]|uniref:SMODS and SLOG-associating 2TM effector domain-containing protein n=1 Tax=Streptomyces netropsis TaxID=55404 RepID=A0A7W7LFJ4_STRNE|nr:hypothetical protein [Streptomyces netropsis]MBB4889209.1 hypothetical protein [Streptomyces netropsis]GGR46742.1 hypothetical protein GCM10010219_60250 [Streptomyces netropsis]